MPYYITNTNPDCSGWAVMAEGDAGKIFGCHETEQDAIDQAVAVSLADNEPFLGKRDVRVEDGPEIGISDIDGTLLDGGSLNEMVYAFIQDEGYPLVIVTGRPESERDSTVKELADAGVEYQELIMNDGSTADSVAFKKATAVMLLETYDVQYAIENNPDSVDEYRKLGIETFTPDTVPAVESEAPDAGATPMEMNGVYKRGGKEIETRVTVQDFEVRETTDGMRLTGYAARFNQPSEPLPFIERVAPGAFKRSLRSKNDIKLLWNHDSSIVLGSTRSGTLTLTEDANGLRVDAMLPDTSAGRDAKVLIQRGDVTGFSFGFTVPKGGDAWSADGQERTLNSVRLHEVSVGVAFPAYPSTNGTAQVRSLEAVATRAEVDADALSAAFDKLEAGQDITADERDLLSTVIDKLAPDQVDELNAEMLALKKKKLDILKSL